MSSYTVTFERSPLKLDVVCHTGSSPLYVRGDGQAAAVKDPACWMVMPGSAASIPTGSLTSFSIVSASTATYSVGVG